MAVPGSVSHSEDVVVCRPDHVPNRLRACTIAQRSAAQNGQNSAPMKSISGLPPAPVRLGWFLSTDGAVTCTPVGPDRVGQHRRGDTR